MSNYNAKSSLLTARRENGQPPPQVEAEVESQSHELSDCSCVNPHDPLTAGGYGTAPGSHRSSASSLSVQPDKCECHTKESSSDEISRNAQTKLWIACGIALVFMSAEIVGGLLSNSLAILTDAAHMLSDVTAYLISLLAIWIARRPASQKMSFGWYRAEVIGAVISVLIIWVLTGVLVYEAILRILNQNYEIEADVMLITAVGGVFVNVFMMAVLSHGSGGHGHNEHHDHHRHEHDHHGDSHHEHSHGKANDSHGRGDDVTISIEEEDMEIKSSVRKLAQNINVRAAFIHVIGDLIQSVGVVTAGYIIKFQPSWKVADPICTFLFSILVLFSTINILRDALLVLMEATPRHVNYEEVKRDLGQVPGVKHTHSLHIWSLTLTRTALAAHLALEPGVNYQEVLYAASAMLKAKHNIEQTTLQVEEFRITMETCQTCQNVKRPSLLDNIIRRVSS